jgi:hypothetical protein
MIPCGGQTFESIPLVFREVLESQGWRSKYVAQCHWMWDEDGFVWEAVARQRLTTVVAKVKVKA